MQPSARGFDFPSEHSSSQHPINNCSTQPHIAYPRPPQYSSGDQDLSKYRISFGAPSRATSVNAPYGLPIPLPVSYSATPVGNMNSILPFTGPDGFEGSKAGLRSSVDMTTITPQSSTLGGVPQGEGFPSNQAVDQGDSIPVSRRTRGQTRNGLGHPTAQAQNPSEVGLGIESTAERASSKRSKVATEGSGNDKQTPLARKTKGTTSSVRSNAIVEALKDRDIAPVASTVAIP
jgi:hypothetical protein